MFDILERVDKPDDEALNFHLQDIVDEDANEMQIWSRGAAHFAKLPYVFPYRCHICLTTTLSKSNTQGTPAYTLFATTPPGSKQRGRPNEPDFVGILLTLVRLEQQNTDIVITVNAPHVAYQYDRAQVDLAGGRNDPLLEAALQYRETIMETFEVKDWDLFVQD